MAINSLFDQMNLRGYVDGWARITIQKWQAELRKKRIGVSGDLEKSFTKEVKRKGAEIAEIVLKFKMYGRFRDMGVGRGVKAFERGSNNQARSASRAGVNTSFVNRRNKRWLNKIKTAQSYRLAEILGNKASDQVISNFNNTNNVTIRING